MILTKIIVTIWEIIFISLLLRGNLSSADTGADFLSSVVDQLKREKISNNGVIFYDNIFGGTRRSSEDYQISESPELAENSLNQPNNEYQNENQNDQLLANQNADPTAFSDPENQQFINQPTGESGNYDQQQQQQQQQFTSNGFYGQGMFQDPQAIAQHMGLHDGAGANIYGSINTVPIQYNLGGFGVNDPQLLDNSGQLINNQVLHHNPSLVPAHNFYYHPTVNSIDENNLIDVAINAMKHNEHFIAGHDPGKTFVVDPLFVAMAGFVSVAMIFMSAVLFLPKLLTAPPVVKGLKGPQELAALTKLAVEAIEGNDCTERIACEVGRAMRSMQVGSEPIKMIEVILPANMAKQLAQIRKAVATKQACKLIQCKRIGTQEIKLKNAIKNKAQLKMEAKKP